MEGEASGSNSNNYTGGDGNSDRGESLVVDVGRRSSSCGYCRSAGHKRISHGLWAHSLVVDDYQALLDRGWRRSGCFLYKPEMQRTCCPPYTIRLKASEFTPSKEQLRVSKRMQSCSQTNDTEIVLSSRFLDGTLDAKRSEKSIDEWTGIEASCTYSADKCTTSMAKQSFSVNYESEKNKVEPLTQYLSHQIDIVVQEFVERGVFSHDLQLPKASVKVVPPAKRKLLVEGPEELMFSCSISFQISAALRRAKKDPGHVKFSKNSSEENGQLDELSPKLIAAKLAGHLNLVPESCNCLVRACNGHINFYSTAKQEQLDDIVRSGTVSKGQPLESGLKDKWSNKCIGISQGKGRHLEIRLQKSSFDPEEYSLYRKYQFRVHDDKPEHVSESSYRRFLVDTPLIHVPPTGDGTIPPCGFGSFHQQYVIDGKLVAVGVLDILPKCLSSKYLFWDPDLASLSLGKYSALEEIRWVSDNQTYCPSLQYYYLGYYIHSCNKMRYKAAYRPSELLCPLRYQWIPFEIASPLLDRKKYVVLSDFSSLHKGESLTPNILQDHREEQHDDPFHGCENDIFVHQDEEMVEHDSEESDDELDPETAYPPSAAAEDGDVDNVLIGMSSVRLRFKELCEAFGPSERRFMETQLQRYMRAVGVELSERMVYSIT